MNPRLILLILVGLASASLAKDAGTLAEDAIVLAVAESAMVAKFGADAVDEVRPLKVRVLMPGRAWRVDGTRSKASLPSDEVLSASVYFSDGDYRATALKRPLRKKPNKAPEPTPRPVMIPAEPGITPGRVVAHL